MSNIGKAVGTSLVAAVAIVVMYSPGLLGLSPMDPSILKAGMSIIGGTLVVGGAGYSYYRLLKPEPQYKMVAEFSDTNDINKVFEEYQHSDALLQKYAENGKEQLTSADKKLQRAHDMLSSRFGEGSMTNSSFSSTVYAAISTVKRNCATLANDLQTFDIDEYQHNKTIIETGEYQHDGIDNDVQLERYQVYETLIEKMDDIVSANERLLLEIDKVLMSMNEASDNTDNSVIVEELRDMTKRLKFYSNVQ